MIRLCTLKKNYIDLVNEIDGCRKTDKLSYREASPLNTYTPFTINISHLQFLYEIICYILTNVIYARYIIQGVSEKGVGNNNKNTT